MFCCNVCSKEFAFFVFAHFGNLKGYLEVNCKVCFCLWSHKKQCSIDISLFVWKVSYLIRTDVCFLNNKLSSKSHSSENRFGQHQKCSLDLFVSITILKHRVNKLCTSSTFGQVLLIPMLHRINDSITQGVCICACMVFVFVYPHTFMRPHYNRNMILNPTSPTPLESWKLLKSLQLFKDSLLFN